MRILVVEDNPGDQYLLRASITDTWGDDCTVDEAACIGDALTLAEQHQYDFCIADHVLFDGNSAELISQLRKHGCRFPIVVLSAFQKPDLEATVREAGANGLISKLTTTPALWATKAGAVLGVTPALQ